MQWLLVQIILTFPGVQQRDVTFFAGTLSRASKQSMIDFQQSKQVINDSFPAEQASNQ